MKNCTALDHGVAVFQDGDLAPCCKFQQSYLPGYEKFTFRDYPKFRIEMQKVSDGMARGEHDHRCVECWHDEFLNLDSMREQSNQWAHIDRNRVNEPQHFELRFGNYCNLKCIMCWPGASSSVQTEYLSNEKRYNELGIFYSSYKNDPWWDTEEFLDFFENIASTVKLLHFTGGEPFIVPALPKILSRVKNPENIAVLFVTNMTNLREKVLDLLSGFESVFITMSLEGVGSMNDYVRFPSRWSDIVANIEKAKTHFHRTKTNLRLEINHTFQHTSVYSFPALCEWAQENEFALHLSPVSGNKFLTMSSVPEPDMRKFLQWASDSHIENENIKRFLTSIPNTYEFDQDSHRRYRDYVAMLDSLRDTDFESTFNPTPI